MEDSRDKVFPGASGSERRRRLILEFESFRDFIQIFSPLVSEEGMFVPSEYLGESQPAVDEAVDFEVRLSDDFRLVHGRGEVAWQRSGSEGGIAVRFLDLDEPSRRLVGRLVSNYVKDGGRPFEVGSGMAAAEPDREPAGGESEPAGTDSEPPAVETELAPEAELAPEPEAEPEQLAVSEADSLFDVGEPPVAAELEELPLVSVDEQLDLASPETGEPDLGEVAAESTPPLVPELGPDEGDRLEIPELSLEPVGAAGEDAEAALQPPVISEDIAQIAEELSGGAELPPVEMPSEEEQTAVYVGAASARSKRSWRTFAIASLAGVALGVAAWFLAGDALKEVLGFGPGEQGVSAEAGPVSSEPPTAPAAGALPSAQVDEPPATDGSGDGAVTPVEEAAPAEEGTAPSPDPVPAEVEAEPQAPSPPAVEAAPAARQVAAVGAAADGVEQVTWRSEDGTTVVAIRLNGAFSESAYEIVRVREGAPREVIKLRGLSRSMSPAEVEIGSEHVIRLRSGLHGTGDSGELHLVADLTSPAVAVTLVRLEGSTLLVTFS